MAKNTDARITQGQSIAAPASQFKMPQTRADAAQRLSIKARQLALDEQEKLIEDEALLSAGDSIDGFDGVDRIVVAQAATPVLEAAGAGTGAGTAGAGAAGTGAAGAGAAAAGVAGAAGAAGLSTGMMIAAGVGVAAAAGGGGGGGSAAAVVVADTTAPAAPVINVVATDNIINAAEKADGVTVSGTAEAGSSVAVTWGDTTHTVTATGGVWTQTFASGEIPADATASISAVATDAAGNVSEAGTRSVTVDTVAPVLELQSIDRVENTVTLTYDGTLDSEHRPSVNDFGVTTNGVANPVTDISVNGLVITLTVTNAFSTGAVTVAYTDPTTGDDVNAIQDVAGNDAVGVSFASGVVADGYVRGATIYIDVNGNGAVDEGDHEVGTTDANGNFLITGSAPAGAIIAVGGVNIDTGVPNTMVLQAPEGSTTINPLTTLVQAVVKASGGQTNASDAASAVAVNLGLTLPEGANLLSYDPISANDVAIQKVAAQVATIVTLAENALAGAGAAVIVNLVDQVNGTNSSTLNLSNSQTLTTVLGDSLSELSESVLGELTTAIGTASQAIEAANALSGISVAQSAALDTVAPGAPTLTVATVTNDSTPTVRVTFDTTATDGTAAVAGDVLRVQKASINDEEVSRVTLTATDIALGYKEVATSSLADGNYTLSAILTDQSARVSAASQSGTVTIDTEAPTAPVINAVTTDNLVNAAEKAAGVTVSGTAEAGSSVAVTWGSTTHTVTATGGVWTQTFASGEIPADATASISAVATDVAGNVSDAATRSVTVDTLVQAPVINAVATDNLVNAAEKAAGVTVSGTAEAGSSVAVTWGSTTHTVTATGGVWTQTFAANEIPADAMDSISAVATDAAGNVSEAATRSVTVDTLVPTVPTVNAVTTDNTINAAEQATAITGTAEANATVKIALGGNVREVTADSQGQWSYTLVAGDITAMGQGAGSISATATDVAGNVSDAATRSVTVDTLVPTVPTVNAVTTDDTINAAEQATAITGTAEANATVKIALGGNVREVTADGQGQWSYTLVAGDITAMEQGGETLSVTATDAAGNVSEAATHLVTVDTVVQAPVINAVATDNLVNAAEKGNGVTVTGTAEAGASVAVTWGATTHTVTATGGNWSAAFASGEIPADGTTSISAVATDVAGNISQAGTRSVSVDTVAPTTPAIDTIAGNDEINAAEQGAAITGTADAGVTVQLTLGGNVREVTANGQGQWSYTLVAGDITAMGQGAGSISATATDAAGNVSDAATRSVTVDTLVQAPVINAVTTDNLVNAAEKAAGVTVSGTAEAGSSVAVTWGNASHTVTATGGVWTQTFASGEIPADATASISAVATDAAGNVSDAATRSVTVDTVTPATPVINAVATDNLVNAAEKAAGVTVSGTAEAGSSVAVTWGSTTHTVTATGGSWSTAFTSGEIPDTSATIVATATDAAGNVSGQGNSAMVYAQTTRIDWTSVQNDLIQTAEDSLYIQVHFTNPVVVTGTPTLSLIIIDASGVQRTVNANFQRYQSVGEGEMQTSMEFVYVVQAGDVGQYHMGEISLGEGASIIDNQNVAADVTINDSHRAITAGTYLYGNFTADGSTVGTDGNDLIAPNYSNPLSFSTAGVNGGAGDRDVLAIPVVLRFDQGILTSTAADAYTLKYDSTSNTVKAVTADGTVVGASMQVPDPLPTGIESLIFYIRYQDSQGEFHHTEANGLHVAGTVATYTDPIVQTEHFVQGTLGADDIDLSGDTSTAARYLVRGGSGDDTITGSAGKDAIFGDGGINTIDAGDGNDVIFVGKGTDTVDGGAGTDKIVVNLDGQQYGMRGSNGGLVIQSATGVWLNGQFVTTGTTDAYRIKFTDGAIVVEDRSSGSSASMTATNVEKFEIRLDQNDSRTAMPVLFGTAGDNTLVETGNTFSFMSGGAGNDTLTAGIAGAALYGGSGNDTLNGSSTTDYLFGGAGVDHLNGNGGNDFLVGGTGNDVLEGGAGFDEARYAANTVGDNFNHVYDAASGAIQVRDGDTVLASIGEGSQSDWDVQDVANQTPTGFGVDAVSGVDMLSFVGSSATGFHQISLHTGTTGDDLMVASGDDGWSGIYAGGAGNDTFDLTNAYGDSVFIGGAGVDKAQMDVSELGIDWSDVLLSQDSQNSAIWHLESTTSDLVLDITKLSGADDAFELTFHDTQSTFTANQTIVGVESLHFMLSGETRFGIDLGSNGPTVMPLV